MKAPRLPKGLFQHSREERVQLLRRPDLVSLEPVNSGLELPKGIGSDQTGPYQPPKT